jgi:hypothetical protein
MWRLKVRVRQTGTQRHMMQIEEYHCHFQNAYKMQLNHLPSMSPQFYMIAGRSLHAYFMEMIHFMFFSGYTRLVICVQWIAMLFAYMVNAPWLNCINCRSYMREYYQLRQTLVQLKRSGELPRMQTPLISIQSNIDPLQCSIGTFARNG